MLGRSDDQQLSEIAPLEFFVHLVNTGEGTGPEQRDAARPGEGPPRVELEGLGFRSSRMMEMRLTDTNGVMSNQALSNSRDSIPAESLTLTPGSQIGSTNSCTAAVGH